MRCHFTSIRSAALNIYGTNVDDLVDQKEMVGGQIDRNAKVKDVKTPQFSNLLLGVLQVGTGVHKMCRRIKFTSTDCSNFCNNLNQNFLNTEMPVKEKLINYCILIQ